MHFSGLATAQAFANAGAAVLLADADAAAVHAAAAARDESMDTPAQHGSGGACGRPRRRANDVNRDTGPIVGASDAEADAARSGSDDADLDDAGRDSDGVPVGSADAEADAENSGADRG